MVKTRSQSLLTEKGASSPLDESQTEVYRMSVPCLARVRVCHKWPAPRGPRPASTFLAPHLHHYPILLQQHRIECRIPHAVHCNHSPRFAATHPLFYTLGDDSARKSSHARPCHRMPEPTAICPYIPPCSISLDMQRVSMPKHGVPTD